MDQFGHRLGVLLYQIVLKKRLIGHTLGYVAIAKKLSFNLLKDPSPAPCVF
jgi:hypothetical protein